MGDRWLPPLIQRKEGGGRRGDMHLNFEFGAATAVICIEVEAARNYNLLQRVMGRPVLRRRVG